MWLSCKGHEGLQSPSMVCNCILNKQFQHLHYTIQSAEGVYSEHEPYPLLNASIQKQHITATCFPLTRIYHMVPNRFKAAKEYSFSNLSKESEQVWCVSSQFLPITLLIIVYLFLYFPAHRKHSPSFRELPQGLSSFSIHIHLF